MPQQPAGARRRRPFGRPRVGPADVVDVFVYVVVLGLADQFAPSVVTESFSASLLTALLLKVVLEVVVVAKTAARGRLRAATTPAGRVGGVVLLWLVLVGSKIAVLELEDLLLGDRVELGGFVAVTGLVIVLLLARAGVRRLLRPGVTGRSSDAAGDGFSDRGTIAP